MMRIPIAAVLGGIAMFLWAGFSHNVLRIAEPTMLPPSSEAALVASMKANIQSPGFYVMPGMDLSRTLTPEESQAWAAKYKEGPNAVLMYHPDGSELSARLFLVELASNILAGLMVAIILSFAQATFIRGLIISTLIGLIAWTAIDVSYWNWFRFPSSIIVAELIDQGIGFLLLGAVAAFILRDRKLISLA